MSGPLLRLEPLAVRDQVSRLHPSTLQACFQWGLLLLSQSTYAMAPACCPGTEAKSILMERKVLTWKAEPTRHS